MMKVAVLLIFVGVMDLFALIALCLWWSSQRDR